MTEGLVRPVEEFPQKISVVRELAVRQYLMKQVFSLLLPVSYDQGRR